MCLLTYLRVSSIMDRYLEYLGSADVHDVDKLHVALHLPLLSDNWNAGRQIQLIEFLDAAQSQHGGSSRTSCITKASRSFAQSLSDERVREILAEGDRWPHAAVALLYRLPTKLDAATLTTLKQLDERLQENRDSTTTRLKVGLVAVMARSGDAESLAYLRALWDRDPERRPAVAMGLAQWPAGENWNYLVRSLPVVEADVAKEILEKLKQVELAPEEPEYYRQVILRGLELDGPGADAAIALLEHWTGTKQVAEGDGKAQLAAWQKWFAQTWPDHPASCSADACAGRIWKYEDLVRQLAAGDAESGSAENGAAVFLSAGCARCHRCGDQGEGRAPDLTGVGQRLMRQGDRPLAAVSLRNHRRTVPDQDRRHDARPRPVRPDQPADGTRQSGDRPVGRPTHRRAPRRGRRIANDPRFGDARGLARVAEFATDPRPVRVPARRPRAATGPAAERAEETGRGGDFGRASRNHRPAMTFDILTRLELDRLRRDLKP